MQAIPLPTADRPVVGVPPAAPAGDPLPWEESSRPLAGAPGRFETSMAVSGIYCPGCSLVIEEALRACPGVASVEVSGASETARVVWSEPARPAHWLAALKRAGYGAAPADHVSAGQLRRRQQRLLLWRWLVAGFCMMQVMMYAAPAYLAQAGEITPDAQSLLRWASWMLTLPVLLFSCSPFLASAWRDLARARVGMDVPVALGILIAFGASTAATWDPAGPWGAEVWYDSLTMFVFFLLTGRVLEQRLRSRTAGALESLARRLPDGVDRIEADGSLRRVPAARLRAGDRIRVRPGEAVAADGVVEAGQGRLDEALLTGESVAVARRPGDAVIAGSHNLDGLLTVRVTAAGAQTRHAAIVALMERAAADKPRAARIADRLAGPFLLGVMLASAAACAWWWPTDPARALGTAIAILIVTCPCALSLATPAATLAAAGALARRGVLVRNLRVLEAGAAIDTVVFDKTGTLTEDRLALHAVHTRPGTDAGQALALAAALAQASLHPLSRALAAAAAPAPGRLLQATEHPGQGLEALLDQDQDQDQDPPRLLRLGSAAFCGAADPAPAAGPQAHLADGAGWLARFDFEEALRPDAASALQQLRDRGLALELLSGDRAAAVQQVAGRLAIAQAAGGCSPEDKLARMRSLQAAGRRVAMVGDGMNDGPVLARADLSVAMGQGVPIAQSRADVVVPGGQLAAVDALLRQARRTRAVVRQNLGWAVAYNAACVPLAVAGWMPPWLAGLGMAASSLLVVANSARLARIPD